jgi:hypothetical protein
MEVPRQVLIHNETLGLKGSPGMLVRIAGEGYYEVNLRFGSNLHRVLLPVFATVLIAAEPEVPTGEQVGEVER